MSARDDEQARRKRGILAGGFGFGVLVIPETLMMAAAGGTGRWSVVDFVGGMWVNVSVVSMWSTLYEGR